MQRAFSPSSYLDRQADQIEALLLDYEAPARVEGGVIREDRVRYHLTPNVGIGVQSLVVAADRVAESLGVQDLYIQAEADSVTLDMPLRPAAGLRMLPLLQTLRRIQPCTSLGGMQTDQRPVLIDWARGSTWHAWISAPGGSGKSELLRSLLISLALTSRSSEVQFLGIDLGGRELAVLEALPQSTYMLASEASYAIELMQWLLEEIEHRKRVGFSNPHLFLFIDAVTGLLDSMGPELDPLLQELALKGRQVGVHVIGASRSMAFDQLRSLHALPGVLRVYPAQASRDEKPSTVGRFVFQERRQETLVDIAWLTMRDLDTAVDLACSGWRACERG
jgi:DNA segregation ATPase FtsK/SpoIIIE-like protein